MVFINAFKRVLRNNTPDSRHTERRILTFLGDQLTAQFCSWGSADSLMLFTAQINNGERITIKAHAFKGNKIFNIKSMKLCGTINF